MSPLFFPTTDRSTAPSSDPTANGTKKALSPLVPGSVEAKVLHRVWKGGECTIVDSPPGAGKSTLVAGLVSRLRREAGLRVLVATPTRNQALSCARMVSRLIGPDEIYISMKDVRAEDLPEGYKPSGARHAATPSPSNAVYFATLKKVQYIDSSLTFDVIVIDEAYQATWAMALAALHSSDQVVMVGDPGQIGPVVTVDVSVFDGLKAAPHVPAPLASSYFTDVERISLETTYRLGADTARLIAPVYRFPFSSGRPATHVVDSLGHVAPEIASVDTGHSDHVDNRDVLHALVERAVSFIGGTFHRDGAERELTASDIAIVVSRNSQVSIVTGIALSLGHDIVVGTADRLQGGEWPVVMALDPMFGVSDDDSADHHQSIGRLCVMLSRHQAHVTWFHDDSWKSFCRSRDRRSTVNRKVRESLLGVQPADDGDIFAA